MFNLLKSNSNAFRDSVATSPWTDLFAQSNSHEDRAWQHSLSSALTYPPNFTPNGAHCPEEMRQAFSDCYNN